MNLVYENDLNAKKKKREAREENRTKALFAPLLLSN